MPLEDDILKLWQKKEFDPEDRQLFLNFRRALNLGEIRAAEKIAGRWQVNHWVKKGILAGFKMGVLVPYTWGENKVFYDKDTYPERQFELQDGVRLVTGGSAVREGAYLAPSVVMMPPSYVNVGAYIAAETMLDSHVLIGSCAQIGKRVHISAAAQIGGVIEPINAHPVIIEDDVFIGGNSGLYEGILVKSRAIIAAGTIITGGTPIFDAVNRQFLKKDENGVYTIPENAVVVPGSRPLKDQPQYHAYCPIIIKYRDDKTELSVLLENLLR